MRFHLVAATVLGVTLAAYSGQASATNVALDFSTLPTAQGWQYQDVYQAIPEGNLFSVDGTALHQNTLGTGVSANRYRLPLTITGSLFHLSVTAKTNADETVIPGVNNHFGFGFGVNLFNSNVIIGIAPHEIDAVVTPPFFPGVNGFVTNATDNTVFHTYDVYGSFATGWSLFVDNVFAATGSFFFSPGDPGEGIFFGDTAGAVNANADLISLSFTQDTPEPASLGLLGTCIALLGMMRYANRARTH